MANVLGDTLNEISLNNHGDVAFHGSAGPQGVFLSKNGQISPVVLAGQSSPDLNGQYLDPRSPILTDSGYIAFSAQLNNTIDGSNDNTGIFLSDGTEVITVARKGDLAPDGNGKLFSQGCCNFAVNEAGQVAFESSLSDTAGETADDNGIFFFDPILGLYQAVRERDPFLGSQFRQLLFLGERDGNTGLSSSGIPQIAFWFVLDDDRTGIATWTFQLPGYFNNDGTLNTAYYTFWRNGLGA
jgi:hypothetical protein